MEKNYFHKNGFNGNRPQMKASRFRSRHGLRFAFAAVIVLSISTACSIHTPEVKFTGEKTALENQILGTYNQVKEDVWMVASVRAANLDSQITLSDEKRAVLTAIQNREFNKDDIDEFKRNGVVGENAKGYLEMRPHERLNTDAEYKKLAEQLVAEENQDRQIIMQRIIDINPNIQASDQAEVEKVFAKLNQDSAKPGEWIQMPDGTWTRKGSEKSK
jgi:uncharacterized protein YdbL (DUF1318 family)